MFILTPYKLSFLNLGLFAIFLGWFLKCKPKMWLIIVVLAMLPVISFCRNTDFNGGMIQNAAFGADFYHSLAEGNLIPRWAGKLDTYFGYPAYLFMYPLPFYFSSFFHLFGFSFVNSAKLVFMTTYVLSGIWMWKWMKNKFKSWPALAASVAYLFAPYRFINMHFRLDIGESVAIALLPLFFNYLDKNMGIGIALLTLGLVMAHPAISVSGLLLAIAYIMFNKKYRQLIWVLIGVLISSYYWGPILTESHYANVATYTKVIEFFPWYNYLFSPYRWGLLFQGGAGKMVFPIGYSLVFVILMTIYKIKVVNKRVYFWLLVFISIGFMLLPISERWWSVLPLLNKFQFSYRLMGVMTVVTAMITGYFFQTVKKNIKLWVVIFIILTVGTTVLNWGNRESRPYSMPDFELERLLSIQSRMWGTGFPQALPKWTNINNLWGPEEVSGPIEILSGTGKISQTFRNSTKHEYVIFAETDMRIKENTFYYPGWKLYINNKIAPIYFENSTEPGVMEFEVTKGENRVKLVFTETPTRRIFLVISTLTACGLLIYGYLRFLGKNVEIRFTKYRNQ